MQQTPTTPASDRPADPARLIDELTAGFRATAEEVVPWFLEQMPLMYFQDTDHATQVEQLRAIIAAKASGRPLELSLRNEDGSEWTLIRPMDYPGVLAEIVSELPFDPPLRAAKIHTAADGKLVVDTFEFGDVIRYDPSDPDQQAKLAAVIEHVHENNVDWSEEEITDFFHRCSAEHVMTLTPLRMCKQWELFKKVTGTDGTAVALESESDPSLSRIVVAVSNSRTRRMLERIANRLSKESINIHRAYMDSIDDRRSGSIVVLGFVAHAPEGGPIDPDGELWTSIRHDLKRLKWIDGEALGLAYRNHNLSLNEAEIMRGLCHLVHQVLVHVNSHAFDCDRILKLTERNLEVARDIVHLFLDRFNPDSPLSDEAYKDRADALLARIDNDVDLEDARTVLVKLVEAIGAVLRTNVYLEDRYAFSLRLDPAFLSNEQRPEMPYGVYFVHGRQFNGFHVRFRDIARGGIRAIRTIGADQHASESDRLYDEAYGLAWAQQLKNKDIPEGGSKAAVLLAPEAPVDRCVKGFVDGILDLITPDEAVKSRIVDRLGQEELLYFGPDENITPDLIEWVVERARYRGYPTPTALMSSKPGAGINHKEYGVTSEGVTVFLDVALRHLGIDPTSQPFTVKMTGGPDGDVAGNEIRILHRDYGDNARILGIADGSGSAEDPDGLDHDELLRLFREARPIAAFDCSRLGPNGRVTSLDEPEGVHLRNTLHNRIKADAFIPAGGRPNAIHIGNWSQFLDENGEPSSKLIVEGANLFLTPDARRELSKAGVLIIKDSSANKCGVICSSYEISACMLLDEQEFLAIKERFVDEVLVKLRSLARREAELLMRLHQHHPDDALPELSTRLSRVMIRTSDAMVQALEDLEEDNQALVRRLVLEHMPPVLYEVASDRLWNKTPARYLRWIIAKSLAARIAYRESFEYLESMPDESIRGLALRYLRLEHERVRLIEEVCDSNLPHKDRIASLLERAGILSTMGEEDT